MKILPSDDLSHKPDYNRNYKKYFKEELVDYLNTQSTIEFLLSLLKTFLQRLMFLIKMKKHLKHAFLFRKKLKLRKMKT